MEAAGLAELLDGPGTIAVFNVQDEYFTEWSKISGTPIEGSKISLLTVQRVPMAYNINPGYPGGFTKMVASACYANDYFAYMSWLLWPPDVHYAPFERCPDVPVCGCRPKNEPGNVFYCKLVKQSQIGMVDQMRVTPGLTDLSPECCPVLILRRAPGTEQCTFTEVELAVAEGQENVSSGQVTDEQLAN